LITTGKEINLNKTQLDEVDFLEITRHRKQVEFVNIAIHEMRVPLHAILNFSELLQEDPTKSSICVEPILRNAKRLQMLSRNMLDLSRIENHSLELNKERFDLTKLISSIYHDMAQSLDKKCHDATMLKLSKSIFITADKERLSQVICNLLANSIKFTSNGIISITIEEQIERESVTVSIKDNGFGINRAVSSLLFSKFVSTSHDGLGLGLFITKNIVEAHGGHIWAQNNTNEKGATFCFMLPVS
jgi:signal transduction histidine kinase